MMRGMPLSPKRHFDEFVVGETLISYFSFSEGDILHFGERYDAQTMHIDPHAAKSTRFGGLIASGWHTAAMTIHHMVQDHIDVPGGIVGLSIEKLQWKAPVRPDDRMTCTAMVKSKKRSASIEKSGVIVFEFHLDNQHGQRVLEMITPTLMAITE